MAIDDPRRHSRWMIRALEWDDSRARYPNLWRDGMPCRILVFDTVAERLRLGDLIAVFHPASQRHADRSERFVGISRVRGLGGSHVEGSSWVDLETAHRFSPPLDLGAFPSRVFLCCDSGWPARDVGLFRRVLEAAISAGFEPSGQDREPPEARISEASDALVEEPGSIAGATLGGEPGEPPVEIVADGTERGIREVSRPVWTGPAPGSRLFGGVDFSGDMRDPKDATWLALVELLGGELNLARLEPTGRAGLEGLLRNPDAALRQAEAIGLDFPFGLPVSFAESLLGGPFPEEGWWALAKKFEKISRPAYLISLQEFRDSQGEVKRLTDDRVGAFSPLHRVNPDLGPMTYHGIRLVAEERSRYALRPFESARGQLLIEVYPGASIRQMRLPRGASDRNASILDAIERAERLPVRIDPWLRRRCIARRDALDAVIAARCAAAAVLSGETEKTPEQLAPGEGARVRREGWIYGLETAILDSGMPASREEQAPESLPPGSPSDEAGRA